MHRRLLLFGGKNVSNQKKVEYRILSRTVIAVAKEGAVGDWAAYIDSVAGNNHEQEVKKVLENGNKLPETVAKVLFPSFKGLIWRH